MFYSITGKLIKCDNQTAVAECGGVAFKCLASSNTLRTVGTVGETVTLFTYLSVKEDALDLFGFSTEAELECFRLLISVNGVGPKAALSVLSELDPKTFVNCILAGDSKTIQRAQGVGTKTAQRIVMELRDKAASVPVEGIDVVKYQPKEEISNASDAVAVLVSLGYSQYEASSAVAKLDGSLSAEQLIKDAMALLSRS
ncbi:MAG: Holliday junction branch migration protein RuvA [Acutalibacteraceae bacterium]